MSISSILLLLLLIPQSPLAVDTASRRISFPPLVRASTTVDAAAVLLEEEKKAEAKIRGNEGGIVERE
ncbi:hypothetical protein CsSME_00042179 [Camellia sinensis var. sinensis]